mgnify:CR=1 FL=1
MYTVEVYKKDARTKSGERQVLYKDYDTDNLSMLEHTVKHTWRASQGFRYEIIHKATNTAVVRGATDQNGLTERYYTDDSGDVFDVVEHVEYGLELSGSPSPRVF